MRRERHLAQIIAEILTLCQTESLFSHILGKCNLNFQKTKYYISLLQRKKLIREVPAKGGTRMAYRTTKNGNQWLKHYHTISDIFVDDC